MHDPVPGPARSAQPDGSLQLLAIRLAQLADDVRITARQLESTTSGEWQSLAAQRFRHQLAREAASVRQVAVGLDEAQHTLAVHCAAVSG